MPFTITKRAQTIGFGVLPGATFGDPPFAVTATASSALPVSFAGSGNCTVSVVTVTILGAGSCTVTATQSGNASFAEAPSVGRTFSIGKAAQSISFTAPPDRTVGDPPFTVTATASSGLTPAFSAGGSCTSAGLTVTVTVSGTCTVTATQTGDANYLAATPVTRTFNVSKLGQSITFGAAGNCTVLTATVTLTGGGSCTITASQPGDAGFSAAAPVSRTFSIAKASQTISFSALPDRTLGDAAFTVTATASSGLAVEFAASGSCVISGLTVTLTGAGVCVITASQPGNASYFVAPPVQRLFGVGGGTRVLYLGSIQVTRQQ